MEPRALCAGGGTHVDSVMLSVLCPFYSLLSKFSRLFQSLIE